MLAESKAVFDAMSELLLAEYDDGTGPKAAGLAVLLVARGPESLKDEDVEPAKEYLRAAVLRWRDTDAEFAELEAAGYVAEMNAKLRES